MIINGNKLLESANQQLIYNSSMAEDYTLSEFRLVLADQVSANNQGEEDAIRGYYRLLTMIEELEDVDSSVIDDIKEIISDEKNHQEKLIRIRNWLDGNIPTNVD